MAMRRWYGKRIHLDVMDRAGQPMVKSVGVKPGGATVYLRFASKAELNLRHCCASRSARAEVGHATSFSRRDPRPN
jgi:hypothetical protein